jgi:hypothetical protein
MYWLRRQRRQGAVSVQAFGVFPAGMLRPGDTYPWSEDLDFRIFKGRVAKGERSRPVTTPPSWQAPRVVVHPEWCVLQVA